MILVSLLFGVTATPVSVFTLLLNIQSKFKARINALYAVIFIGHSYPCANPFIYATKFDPVRRVLVGLIPWKKSTQPHESNEMVQMT